MLLGNIYGIMLKTKYGTLCSGGGFKSLSRKHRGVVQTRHIFLPRPNESNSHIDSHSLNQTSVPLSLINQVLDKVV